MKNRPVGFTLLETIVSIALILAIAGVGWVFSTRYLEQQHVRAAAEIVVHELSLAQAEAITQSSDSAHGIFVSSDLVVRFAGDNYATRDASQDTETDFFGSFTVSGTTEFVFPATEVAPSVSGTLTIQSDTLAIDITVNNYGVVETSERAVSS